MSPAPLTLFELFGNPTTRWPSDAVRQHTGHPGTGTPDPGTWLEALDKSVRVQNVRTGALGDRVSVEAELTVDPSAGFHGYPEGWPFVIASLVDVEFRIRPYPPPPQPARATKLFASVGDSGFELVLEGLPVEIRLPTGLVEPHPDDEGDPSGGLVVDRGTFEPGRLDDLRVVYRRGEPTSIFVHVRIYVSETYEVHVQPAVPISFERCSLSRIPCKAVHDFRLIPSPELAYQQVRQDGPGLKELPPQDPRPGSYEWLRHRIDPWRPSHTRTFDGLFSVRSVDVDENAAGLQDVVEWLNGHTKDTDPTADLVLGDLVVPFLGPFWLPVPRHLTAGIRRKVLDPGSKNEAFAFERAPVHLYLCEDHRVAFNVESLFYRSQPASAQLSEHPGLTFSAALVFGKDTSPQHAFEFGLEDETTFVVGYQRDFSSTDGTPVPGNGAERAINAILHWEIGGAVILDIMSFRLGLSLHRKFVADKSWGDSTLATADIFVSMPPTGSDRSWFRLRALNGEKVEFTMEGIGWRLGSVNLKGLALPDGVVAYISNVALVLSEVGLLAEEGASYLSFSGGLLIELPSGLTGGATVKRLRFRVAGNDARPSVKMDGFFLFARNADASVVLEAGGYFSTQETDEVRTWEFAFAGLVSWTAGTTTYRLGLDVIVGNRRDLDGEFDYFMCQAYFKATIGPLGAWEFTGARVLFARNMLPKLSAFDLESRELRYYSWHKNQANPLTVLPDRRLTAWRPEDNAWALGVGASGSLPAFGKVVELSLFLLGINGQSEKGLLAAAEVFALSNTRPLGYATLEIDRRNDRTSFLVGVDARASSFVKNAPAWMDGIGTFTGTLFVSNDPCTFAIGRLGDQATWLRLRFDVDLWLEASLIIGVCLELVEDGPKGFALSARVEGGIGKKGYVRLTYNAGWSVVVLVFTTGSSDYAAVITIEAGIRFVLFGFLRIGVSARMDFRVVGADPARGELTAEIRLETPWFLPDVTWRLDAQFGELAPERLSTAVSPLRSAGALEQGTLRQLPTHVERFDPSWGGEGVAPVHSVAALRAPTRPEAQRLANVEADADLRPVATDATIGITWSVAVNDKLGLGSGMATGLGNQRSGDLRLTYDLVGIAVRRRARFGADRAWKPLEEKIELPADFSDPNGVQLGGSFGPQVLNKTWDVDIRVAGNPAPKKLLLNGVAPYEFTTGDPETDEELVRRYPSWPCCPPGFDQELTDLFHRIHWHDASAGSALEVPTWWRFSDSGSSFRFLRPAWARPAGYGGLAPGTLVGAAQLGEPGVVARADLDEDAAFCRVRLAWPRTSRVTLVAFDRAGREVRRLELQGGSGGHQTVLLGAAGPIRRLEIRAYRPLAPGTSGGTLAPGLVAFAAASTSSGSLLELDEVAYVGLRDFLDALTVVAACDGGVPGGPGGFDGSGKLAFLPNHEYEVRLTTRVSVEHPSTQSEAADVEEFVYFRTKGLPGLNAVARTGDELQPYVRGAYAGGRAGAIYREEPVTLAFSEGFHVAVPLSVRPPGTVAEQATLLRMQLLVTPELAVSAGTAFTVTADDWIATHHGAGTPPPPTRGDFPWFPVKSLGRSGPTPMLSSDPFRQRLAVMTQRGPSSCGLSDPRAVTGTVLVGPPQGGGPDPGATPPGTRELWAAGSRFTASVRVEGAGFVDRRPFAEGDETALSVASAADPSAWAVSDGELRVSGAGPSFALFGEPDWDHLVVVVGIARPQSDSDGGAAAPVSAGVGVGLPNPSGSPRGLFAKIELAADGGSGRLVVLRRGAAGGALTELDAAELPQEVASGPGPVALEVTAFDDRLRASVGDAVVEVERDEIRAGRLCLTADGSATFTSLRVRGLDLYAFPFSVSRFRSFGEHVGSWGGRLDEIGADVLGPGTTTATVDELWSATSSEIDAVMVPDTPSAERERVFAAWVAGLGLPFNDDVTALEISRVVEAARTRALLVESPEPLDFTEEIDAVLVHRERVGPIPPHPPRPPLGPILPAGTAARALRDELERVALDPIRGDHTPRLPRPDEAIVDAQVIGDHLRLLLHPVFANAGELTVVLVGTEVKATAYRGRVRPPLVPGKPVVLHAERWGPLPRTLPPGSEVGEALEDAQPATVLLATNDLLRLLGRTRLQPVEVDVEVPVRVLQSGDGRRALLIPLSGTAPTPLLPKPHRLVLRLSRRRWETTDPADELNTYAREATLTLDL
jgi:hypothetical protein